MDSYSKLRVVNHHASQPSTIQTFTRRTGEALDTRAGLIVLAVAAALMLVAFEQAVVAAVRQGEMQRLERSAQLRALASCSALARDALRSACLMQLTAQGRVAGNEAEALMARPVVLDLSRTPFQAGTSLASTR